MRRILLLVLALLLIGCAGNQRQSPEQTAYAAFINMLNEQITTGKIIRAEAEYLAVQKANELNARQGAPSVSQRQRVEPMLFGMHGRVVRPVARSDVGRANHVNVQGEVFALRTVAARG